ncbi:molybdopterin oxidoreductase [Thermincola ferriacetica]|uniref:Molybdopterin oxidoreductase n=4 Tax=Thermincola TaxID=278993 RepID=D5XCI4_THEPJ|nr:molybdopterin oxidoreductase [Thermincola potens JR]KNZ69901.1 molybdopterin oxidoreductase [Thermincola ferriacetica]
MAEITLTIDGQQVTVPAGTTVLEAAEKIGAFIPTFCHDPELSQPGACRICVVEIEGWRNLPASCVTAVAEGMVVHTASPAVVEARKTILDLMLANHPEDCMTCQKFGNCKLADYAYYYGIRKSSFEGERHNDPVDDSSAVILRDTNKCILCGKCVRVCDEIQGRHVLDFMYRGFNTKVGPAFNEGMGDSECVSCGSCVAVCPVGALTEKNMQGLGRSWEVKKVKTTCPYCGCGCNFDLNVKDGKVIGVTSNPTSEVNGRHLCVKGRFGYDFVHSPDRLTKPLIKKEGDFVEVSWDEALSYVAARFNELKEKHGSDALGALTSARCTNEENYLVNKLARVGFGTNNIDHCARL